MKGIDIKTRVSLEDLRKFVYFNVLFKRIANIVCIITGAVLSTVYILYAVLGITELERGSMVFCIGYILVILLMIAYMEFDINGFKKKNIVDREVKLNLNENGIAVENDKSYEWDSILRVFELKNYFFVYYSNVNAIIINKKCLSKDEAASVAAIFENNVSGKYKKRYRG